MAGLCLGVLALLMIGFLPRDSAPWIVVSYGTGPAVLVALTFAIRGLPPRVRGVWWAFWAYLALTVAGDSVWAVLQYGLNEDPFPSWADVLYLASYVPVIIGLTMLIRLLNRERELQTWIDSAIIMLAAASVVVTFVLVPMLTEAALLEESTYVALAYPLLDLIVLATLTRLTLGGRRPSPALVLLAAAIAVTLTADLFFTALAVNGNELTSNLSDVLFALAELLLLAAALAPGASAITQPAPPSGLTISRSRTCALGVGALTAPVLLAIGARGATTQPVFLIALIAIAVNLLVLWRILILLATVELQSDRLDVLSRTDALTGLPNRRSWDFELIRRAASAAADGVPLTVAIADLDRFKDFNDRYGHLAGDALLEQCTGMWRDELDSSIFLARYGGEEFALILSGRWSVEAPQVLERMRRATPAPVTLTIGYADFDPGSGILAAVERADQSLFEGKVAGRNLVLGTAR